MTTDTLIPTNGVYPWDFIESRHGSGFRIRRILDQGQREVIGQVAMEDDAHVIVSAITILKALVNDAKPAPQVGGAVVHGHSRDHVASSLIENARDIIAKAERAR